MKVVIGAFGRTSEGGIMANSIFGNALQKAAADLPEDATVNMQQFHSRGTIT